MLSRFALLSLDVHSAVSSSNNGQSLLLLCFMTDASNQLLAASLSLRESLFPPPFKNNQLSNPPIPLSLSFYHCIYALQLISSNIHNHFSASLSLSSDFFLLSSRISLSVSSSRFPLAQFASSDIYQPNLAP